MLIELLAIALLTALLVGAYRCLAQRWRWFDVPNQRSSHQRPIPRGAGIVFAILISTAIAFQMIYLCSFWPLAISMLLGGGVAAAGWYDDLRGLSALWRFLIYLCANAGAAVLITPTLHLVWIYLAIIVVVAFALTWWTNLYNFMDGINGIATLQGVFMALSAWLLTNRVVDPVSEIYPLVAASLLGFLPWNFPRARVFMGDSGSTFLGFLFGVLALWSVENGALSLCQWLILAGVFIVDASYTLLVRLTTGQRWREAHRSHAYQHLVDRCGGHSAAVILLMTLNVSWLLPWSWLAGSATVVNSWIYLLVAYVPLLGACWKLRAGLQ